MNVVERVVVRLKGRRLNYEREFLRSSVFFDIDVGVGMERISIW